MNILFMGPPGAGKGRKQNGSSNEFQHSAYFDRRCFRLAMKQGTPLGLKAKEYVDQGLACSGRNDERYRERTSCSKPDCDKGFLLDGFRERLLKPKRLMKC